MDGEDLGSQRKEWAETVRVTMLKKLFPNAPKRSRCKTCKATYPNSILTGSSITHSMCPECITARIGTRRFKKTKQSSDKTVEMKPREIKQENLMTLKQYLEMEI